MSRRRRRLRRARGAALRCLLLVATAWLLCMGLWSRLTGTDDFRADTVPQPTATPVTAAFDETVTEREITLEAETWYAIQTGVYSTREAADSRANAYADRGAPGYVAEDDGKWRVFIACYGSKNDASAVQERLKTMQQVDTHLHAWTSPQLTLKLSGMAGQLDVAQSGVELPEQAAAMLRDAAVNLDAGETTLVHVQQLISDLDESITLWAKTAKERFFAPYPVMVECVLEFAQAWPAMRSRLMDARDATECSAQMKTCAMQAYDYSVAIRWTLLGN